MPSYVIHLSCAKCALPFLPVMDDRQKNLFYLGNIAADMCKDKHYTHFWNDATYCNLERKPDLEWFLQKYGDAIEEPYVLGYYAHLLLDLHFLDDYWANHFRFYNKEKKEEHLYDAVTMVEVTEQQRLYDRKDFFSKKWYYGDYDRMNGYFAKKYEIEFPSLELSTSEWKQVQRITEIDWEYAKQAVERTRNLLKESIMQTEGTDIPELQIFQCGELERLMQDTAKKVAEI